MNQPELALIDPEPVEMLEDEPRLVKPRQLDAFVRWARSRTRMFADFETRGIKVWQGASAFQIGLWAEDVGPKVLDLRLLGEPGLRAARDALAGRRGLTGGFNLTFECDHAQHGLGIEIGGSLADVQAMAFALEEERTLSDGAFGPYSQKALCRHELGRDMKFAKAVRAWLLSRYGKDKKTWDYSALPQRLGIEYLCEDLEEGARLWAHFEPKIEADGMADLVRVDSEMCRSIADMEHAGVCFDVEEARRVYAALLASRKAAYAEFREAAGRDVRLGSAPEEYRFYYVDLGLPLHEDQEKAGSVDDDVLAWFEASEDLPDRARICASAHRDWREADVLARNYLLPWLEQSGDGKLHLDLDQFGAVTGRMSAKTSRLHGIPSRGRWAEAIKRCFPSPPGEIEYEDDYSQVQPRIFAAYSNEPLLIEGYLNDPSFDAHQRVADEINIKRPEGKTMNLAFLFGQGVATTKRKLLRPEAEAEEIVRRYHARLPGIKRLQAQLKKLIRQRVDSTGRGWIKDAFGRRRHLRPSRWGGERGNDHLALNFLCQGGERGVMARAMVRTRPIVRAAGGTHRLVVHDALRFSLPGRSIEDHKPILREVRDVMQDNPEFRVPLTVGCKALLPTLADAKEVEL